MRGIDRRRLLLGTGAAVSALGWPSARRGETREHLRRVGVLMSSPRGDGDTQVRMAALQGGLRELGWIEGQNLHLEYRWAPGDPVLLQAMARELVVLGPDLVLANSTPAALAMKLQGTSIPVVFVQVTDPLGQGLVASLAHPGGNLTGFTSFEFSIATKWLEMLKTVAPQVGRIALLFNPQTAPFAEKFYRPVEAAAPSFDATAINAPVRDETEIERLIETLAHEQGGLMVLPDVSATNHRGLIIALAERHRVPAIYPFRYFAMSGGLMSYGSEITDIFRRAAAYIDRILKGADAGALPVQTPNRLELVMNLKAAKAIGITMPPLLVGRADEVIE